MSKQMSIFPERLGPKGWEYCGEYEDNIEYEPDNPDGEPELALSSLYIGTNSALFALLGTRWYPILGVDDRLAHPRGLPPDLSPDLRQWAHLRQKGAVGHSWLTARELLAFPWEQETTIVMMVNTLDMPKFIKNKEIAAVLQQTLEKGVKRHGVAMMPVDWQSTYAQAAGPDFMHEVVDWLRDRYGPVDDARVVYWIR